EDWLAERVRESAKLEADTLFFTKAAFWIGGLGLLVAIIIAQLDRLAGERRRGWPRLAAAGRAWAEGFSVYAGTYSPCYGWTRPALSELNVSRLPGRVLATGDMPCWSMPPPPFKRASPLYPLQSTRPARRCLPRVRGQTGC